MGKKGLLIVLAAVLVLCIIGGVLLFGRGGEEEPTFRSAKVLSVTGQAQLLRDGEEMSVYEGLLLRTSDQITTGADGRVDLQLDTDKYVVLEADTQVCFRLEGSPEAGLIRLEQTSGTVHHKIENPLAQEDGYEVQTPESVMAVRGTEFTTTRLTTAEGGQTQTQVRKGRVDMTLPGGEKRTLGAGENATASQAPGEAPHFVEEKVEKLLCPACGQEVQLVNAHKLSCGGDHYSCDQQDHTTILSCGNLVCTEGHEALPCGHCGCDKQDHTTILSCGSLVCAEGHEALACGHCGCDKQDHATILSCGSLVCAEGHEALPCGHCGCDKQDHTTILSCGSLVCAEGHEALACGHCGCDKQDHSTVLSCGSLVCAEGHEALACGHCGCDGKAHTQMACGHFACDTQTSGNHQQLSCGSFACREPEHTPCEVCGDCTCTGEHALQVCGHYGCQEGSHQVLDCGFYGCQDGHGPMACGHCSCCEEPEYHQQRECGHYECEEDTFGDHTLQSCGCYDCWGREHWPCDWCYHCLCTGTHSEEGCKSPEGEDYSPEEP